MTSTTHPAKRPQKSGIVSEVTREKVRLFIKRSWKVTNQIMKNPMGVIGVVILVFFTILAAFGPYMAPYEVEAVGPYEKWQTPGESAVPAPDWVRPAVYLLPPVISLVASFLLFVALSKPVQARRNSEGGPLSFISMTISAGVVALVLLVAIGRPEALKTNDWLYAVSIAGIAASVLALAMSESFATRRRHVGMVIAAASPFVLFIPFAFDMSSNLFNSILLVAYILAGALLFVSGSLLSRHFKEIQFGPTSARYNENKYILRKAQIVNLLTICSGAIVIVAGLLAYLESQWTLHWMGIDTFQNDIFSELLYGARTSLIVGIFSAVIASFLGAAVGLYSGYVGGWPDEVIMRANDVVLSIPWLVLMIIVAAMLGTIDLLGIILIIGLTGWSATARMVRAQVLSIRERQYIERARAIGSSDMEIIRRHVLPNAFPLVFANTILTVAVSILSEATLSFLGMRPVGVVTWGTMLSYASSAGAFTIGLQWWIVAPGLCIVTIVLGFTLLGYAMDDVMNPKLRKR